MAPRGTIWGSICIEVTLSDIETIWTKFGQNPGFSLRKSVSLTPGPTVKENNANLIKHDLLFLQRSKMNTFTQLYQMLKLQETD